MSYDMPEFAQFSIEEQVRKLAGSADRRLNDAELANLIKDCPLQEWDLDEVIRVIKWLATGTDDLAIASNYTLMQLQHRRDTANLPVS